MPDSVIWRKSKIGFNSPLIQWMQRDKNDNGLKEWFLDLVHDKGFIECDLIENPKKIQAMVEKICSKKESNFSFWRAAMV